MNFEPKDGSAALGCNGTGAGFQPGPATRDSRILLEGSSDEGIDLVQLLLESNVAFMSKKRTSVAVAALRDGEGHVAHCLRTPHQGHS